MAITTRFTTMGMLALSALLTFGFASCDKDEDTTTPTASYDHQHAPTQFVAAGDTKFAYRILGNNEGVPLVVLAPLGSTMDDWDPAVTDGFAKKYKVILFDNAGVGSSTGKTPSTIADMAKGAVTFIKAMGYSRVNLLAFSMGSFVAQQIALTEPALINKMVLTGVGPKGSEGLSKLPEIIGGGQGLSAEESFLYFGFTKSEASRAAGKLSYARIQLRQVDRDKPLSDESSLAELTAVLGWAQPAPDALKELESVKIPVLLIQGKEDLPVPVINPTNMAQHLPNARLIVYEDAAHASLFQLADKFVKDGSDFLGE
ncbi:alpha/beta fold hydrolase [Chitinophaga pinensis]|uniref:Alpha/beta hydrolase fold protein n=1 Tax=Chitinophaga pinensis (strain ATCC 43595 / DSM 2588 / LMG 13176 / NBRC 15968 / NCIMB 11800 / UQM 2034) TaxID=485918 RepID=A0A979G7Z2_CHIPD|nr:alpha/beta hydrolase [Chitinophaga pinensis]ACU62649.1 alpha/beta hydrolase fold protein [Chitinophaga pinensis DSM 2588]